MTSGGHSRIIPPLFVLLKLHNKRIHVHIAIKYFIITVANIMIKKSVNRVPVVDENDKIKGIICRYDIIKSMYEE